MNLETDLTPRLNSIKQSTYKYMPVCLKWNNNKSHTITISLLVTDEMVFDICHSETRW